jgi:epoxyqueuosine reductase
MNELIRRRALQLGFDDCRVTTADPPQSADQFEQWLAEGQHGEMAYLARNAHKRVDPRKVLPQAKSIIMLAASYAEPQAPIEIRGAKSFSRQQTELHSGTADAASESSALPPASFRDLGQPAATNGLLARYARFEDYHHVLGVKLQELATFINQLGGPETRSLWYVDTGPLLERDLGQRAGLGFIGKHTNLISRRLGNWFFLGEIISTLALPSDPPETNRCGSCTRCLAACPTQAIRGPFRLDARLCISYLTIELKGPIPKELRSAIGNRIYGCDDCLAACPWNRFAHEGAVMKTAARRDLASPDLVELLALDEDGFKRRFSGTPVWRTKRRGLLRNVCVALGNVGDRSALAALVKAEQDPEPLIAEHAHWAVERILEKL